MRLKNRVVKVRFDIPENCDPGEVASFIAEALSSWGGGGDPESPLYESLNVRSVAFGGIEFYVKESK